MGRPALSQTRWPRHRRASTRCAQAVPEGRGLLRIPACTAAPAPAAGPTSPPVALRLSGPSASPSRMVWRMAGGHPFGKSASRAVGQCRALLRSGPARQLHISPISSFFVLFLFHRSSGQGRSIAAPLPCPSHIHSANWLSMPPHSPNFCVATLCCWRMCLLGLLWTLHVSLYNSQSLS